MKNRLVKKVERKMLVDKLCELQREICEHERFEGDLLVMLCTGKTGPRHLCYGSSEDFMDSIWDKVQDLVNENKKLKATLDLAGIKFDTLEEK